MKVYITFTQAHVHSIAGRTLDKDTVAVIECHDYETGRAIAFTAFEGKFHECYHEKDWNAEISAYYPEGLVYL